MDGKIFAENTLPLSLSSSYTPSPPSLLPFLPPSLGISGTSFNPKTMTEGR